MSGVVTPGQPSGRRLLAPVVQAALDAVMRDLAAHRIGLRLQVPERRGEGVPGPSSATAEADDQPADLWVWQDDGSGTGVFVDPEAPDAESAAHVADVVHGAAVEALWGQGRDTAWPPCPEHPEAHPLVVAEGDPEPCWTCPRSGAVHAPVGSLG